MSNTSKDLNNGRESVEDTLSKIAALLGETAKKDDIDGLKSQILNFSTATNEEIVKLKNTVNAVENKANDQQEQISLLQANVEILKQDQLKNNISIAGIPVELVDGTNSDEVIINISSKVGVEISKGQFTSHTVANNRFVIAQFYDFKHKQMLINQLRMGKKLIVKEIFANASSNENQIFVNDHLTPYFNKLYLMARNAKKEGKLHTVSSYNGRIRVRKHSDDVPIIISNESQLQLLINLELSDSVDLTNDNSQLVGESNNASTSTRKSEKVKVKAKEGYNGRTNKQISKRSRGKSPKSPDQIDASNNKSKRNKSNASNSAIANA